MQVEKLEKDVGRLGDQLTTVQSMEEQVKAAEQQFAGSADRDAVAELRNRVDAVEMKLAGLQAVARGNTL